jgi:serine/threonine-protein kinase HipA
MIRVWSDSKPAGVLDKWAERPDRPKRGSTFAYDTAVSPDLATSVTMPVRIASYNEQVGLHPIFDMNLPEGELRERLRLRFAKAVGTFDDFDVLSIVGRTQIGRMRYSAPDSDLSESVPFQSIDEILRVRRGNQIYDYLLDTFAIHSGLSGVQPKVMIRGEANKPDAHGHANIRGATHIVKLWDAAKYPELAANEFFCLTAAKNAGLAVPTFDLSDDGAALVVERFDQKDGVYLGFEDFCVLNGVRTDKKYSGGYETRLFKRLRDFIDPVAYPTEAEKLFRLFVLNCAIRNGDAHLKNFGISYSDVNGAATLAPVYDLVTTSVYIPKDAMALTLDGSTNWPDPRKLVRLGQSRADLSAKQIEAIFEATADAAASTAPKMLAYFKENAKESEVGDKMRAAWEDGIKETLGLLRGLVVVHRPKSSVHLAPTDSLILKQLHKRGGSISGSQRAIAAMLKIPPSTFNAALRRLVARSAVRKDGNRLEAI